MLLTSLIIATFTFFLTIVLTDLIQYIGDRFMTDLKIEQERIRQAMIIDRERERAYALAYIAENGNGYQIARDHNLFGFYRTLK